MEQTKKCSKCGEVKPLEGFHKKHGKPVEMCKACACEKTRQWSAANKERKRAADKKYHTENPPTSEQVRAAYLRNREKKLAYGKQYRLSNPEKRKATLQQSAARHPETKARNRAKDSANKKDNPQISKIALKKQVDTLSDGYVKSLLTSHSKKRNGQLIPPELIDTKREQLQLYRLAKKLTTIIKTQKENP